jgi:hypothetical protein
MAECECIAKCLFFNGKMDNMPPDAESIKQKYCRGEFTECARYKVFKVLGKCDVPRDLFPHENDRAAEILKDSKT